MGAYHFARASDGRLSRAEPDAKEGVALVRSATGDRSVAATGFARCKEARFEQAMPLASAGVGVGRRG